MMAGVMTAFGTVRVIGARTENLQLRGVNSGDQLKATLMTMVSMPTVPAVTVGGTQYSSHQWRLHRLL
jgi:hypothetical protein